MSATSAPDMSSSGLSPFSGGSNSLSALHISSSETPQRLSGHDRTGQIPRPGHGGIGPGHQPIRGPPPGGPRFRARGPMSRGIPTPFFIREIYKNGFLKRLPYNERKSSALSKLLRSDRYWVVFSVHDDTLPFLELWNEPTEVATRPPHLMFPLAICKHISPSIVPADNEWTFVVNFETAAIRFSCNSRNIMEEWVECIRMKLGEMGVLNPKGNLYSKVPPPAHKLPALSSGDNVGQSHLSSHPPTSHNNTTSVQTGRNPMSPLPEPPVEVQAITNGASNIVKSAEETQADIHHNLQDISSRPRTRASIVDASDESNQTFTTSIYLNQTPPNTPHQRIPKNNSTNSEDITFNSTTTAVKNNSNYENASSSKTEPKEVPTKPVKLSNSKATNEGLSKTKKSHHVIPAQSYEQVVIVPPVTQKPTPSTSSVVKSKVSLSKSVPATSFDATMTTNVSTSSAATSVYLNKANDDCNESSTRHVTVIPINSVGDDNPNESHENTDATNNEINASPSSEHVKENLPSLQHPKRDKIVEESYYDAIFEFDDHSSKLKSMQAVPSIPSNSSATTIHPSSSILKTHSSSASTLQQGNITQSNTSLTPSSISNTQHQMHQSPKKRQQSPPRPSTSIMGRQSEPLPPPPPPSLPYENFILEGDTKERRERERERRRRRSREELGSRASPNKATSTSTVSRRCSDKRIIVSPSGNTTVTNTPLSQPQKIRRQKGQRSSSLGPLVDDHVILTSKKSLGSAAYTKENYEHSGVSNMLKFQSRTTNTNSLESVDSNPRHAVAKCDQRRSEKESQAAVRAIRAAAGPRRPPLNLNNSIQPIISSQNPSQQDVNISTSPSATGSSAHPLIGSPPRHVSDLPPGVRPPPYHPLASLQAGSSPIGPSSSGLGPHPPHIPLPGLTCQLSFVPSISNSERSEQQRSELSQQQSSRSCLREQQVLRLRQEIMHPSGVRLTIRKRDCHNSLALVEFFGCVWVVGWKQREFPVLYNAFHVGDQILSVSGVPIKTANEFNKLVKYHPSRSLTSGEPWLNSQQPPTNSNLNVTNVSQGQFNSSAVPSNPEPLPHVEIIVRRLPFAQGKFY